MIKRAAHSIIVGLSTGGAYGLAGELTHDTDSMSAWWTVFLLLLLLAHFCIDLMTSED